MRIIYSIIAIAGGFLIAKEIDQALTDKKLFISFAIEDQNLRDLFVGQLSNSKVEYRFNDLSVKEPWTKAWKTECRKRIKKCDGVIILLTKNTMHADGVHWEAKCAQQENVPIRVMYATKHNRPKKLPKELSNIKFIKWKREAVSKFIQTL